jgi:hypothetical protein
MALKTIDRERLQHINTQAIADRELLQEIPDKHISRQPIDNEMHLDKIGCLGFSVTGITFTPFQRTPCHSEQLILPTNRQHY